MKNGRRHGVRGTGWASGTAVLTVWLLAAPAYARFGLAQHPEPAPPRIGAEPRAGQAPEPVRPGRGPGQGQSQPQASGHGEHLPEWMATHQSLNPQQREQALRREPGFSRLPSAEQQQLIDRLHKLESAPPQVRERMLARNELFERLAPEQKQEIRAAGQALSQMPPERNAAVRHAFHDLRSLPPDQRQLVLNSARFQAEFSPQERNVLSQLLSIEPY